MKRFPDLVGQNINDLILDKEGMIPLLRDVYLKLIQENLLLEGTVSRFVDDKSPNTLLEVCKLLNNIIPMQDGEGNLNPLISTQEQITRFLDNNLNGFGDCKLLTIIAAFICNIIADLPTLISIRNYSGHPVLYIETDKGIQKISFLHASPEVKEFKGKNPFLLTSELAFDPNFVDPDFQRGKSILYWKILDAILVLDCLNILRRTVVNYSIDPDLNEIIYMYIIEYLQNSGIYSLPVIDYWENEFDRVKQLWQDPRSPKDPEKFRNAIAASLRFTE